MIDITEKKVPHLFRNKYLRNGNGSVNISTQSPGQSTPGGSVDIIKSDSATVPGDSNVLSSLRALLEIRSRIVSSTDEETVLTEENTLSSLYTIAEIDSAIKAALKDIEALYLSKTKADTAAEAITFLKGLFVGDNLAFIDANGDAEVRNIVARIKAKVATLEVTGDATTLNLLVQQLATIYDLDVTHVAMMFRTIIKDYVSSETFIPGLIGEGMKIYKALNGDWNLEVDNAVIRKTMTIFELIISKIRAVNGGLVISPANGRIKSVAETTGDPTYYVLGIEGDMQFVADDLVRCQVFTAGQVKYYWVPVASVTTDSILVLKSEFANGVTPVPGDDLIQMGNRTNTARQGLLYLTASEDGKPRFSVLDGVDSTSLVGKSKVILGCLDGMTDTDFPADFQPSGYGLYAMNVFLKGVFLLRNGKSVESEIDAAKDAAQDAQDKADAVTRLFQEFTVAGGLFESKITEVKTYAENKADAAKNAAIDAAALDAQNKASAAQAAAELVAIAQAALAKTEASAYADGIVTAEEQRAINDAKAKLEEAKFDATTKADAAKNAAIEDAVGKYNTKSEVSSLISQTKDEINLSVTEKISNVQVGGRNLAVGSDIVITSNDHQHSFPSVKEWRGKYVTVSCYIEISNTSGSRIGAEPSILFEDGSAQYLSCWMDASAGHSYKGRLHATYKIHDKEIRCISQAGIYVQCIGDITKVGYLKVELGNKPTDWTPAPEDVQTQITANASAIEINKQGIALKASQSEVNGLGNRLTSAEGSLSVQAGQIAAQVSSVNALTGRMSSAEFALQPGNIWLGIKDNVQANIPNYVTQVDTRLLDPNKYYLVTIRIGATIPYTITVERGLSDYYGVPPYATHPAGFSVMCKWQSNGNGWGVIPVKRIIQSCEVGWSNVVPVGSISQITESSEEYIYVRGGSIYNVRIDGESFVSVALHTSTHHPRPDYPESSRPGVIDSVVTPMPDLDQKVTEEQVRAGIGITPGGITVFGQTISLSGAVTFSSLDTATQNTINSKATTGYVDSSKSAAIIDSRNNVAQNLGYASYADMESKAIAGQSIITGGKIRTELVDARAIVTGVLLAEQIAATNISTGKLTVTDGARIGGMKVSGDSLTNEGFNNNAYIILRNDPAGTFAGIGANILPGSLGGARATGKFECAGYNYNSPNTAMILKASGSTRDNIALDMQGKVKTDGSFGRTCTYEFDAVWNNGWRKASLSFTNGILTDFRFTS